MNDLSLTNKKRIISIVQIVLLIFAAWFPYIEKMFNWYSVSTLPYYSSFQSRNFMSLKDIMTDQQVGVGPIPFYIFYILLGIMALYCIIQIFVEHPFLNKKLTVIIPTVILFLACLMIFSAAAHEETFTYKGDPRRVIVYLKGLAYVELLFLSAITGLECFKQFKITPITTQKEI